MTPHRCFVCLFALLSSACGPAVDIIDHSGGPDDEDGGVEGEEDGASEVGDGSESEEDDDAPMAAGGNYPLPLVADCGSLPEGVEALDDLVSAWVVDGARPAGSTDVPVDPGSVRLRLASIGLPADAPPGGEELWDECGPQGWMFAFDIPQLTVGVHPLASIAPSYPEMFFADADSQGDPACGQGGSFGETTTPGTFGELEIFAVTSTCVLGEIRGADEATTASFWVRNGGFVAVQNVADNSDTSGG